jgi:tetratricopeptide (TPR) repeat protein
VGGVVGRRGTGGRALRGSRAALGIGWAVTVTAAVGVRVWNALTDALMWGYDAWGHVAYVLFLDLYRSVPWADQGWSYFHPPLHYALGWLLAQFGSGEVLMRGLSLLGGAASLLIAALAAQVTRMAAPDRPGLPLLTFATIAFLPVHLIVGSMPGNEMTLGALAAGAIVVFIANERRATSSWLFDGFCGVLVGAALLTKFSGLLPLLVVAASLVLRPLITADARHLLLRNLGRAALISAVACILALPYYARNVRAFGTPFELSRGYPLIAQVEGDQPPGVREVADYLRLSPKMFRDPNPLAPHLLNSIWSTAYLNVWADIFRESDVERALQNERGSPSAMIWLPLLGLVPTALAGLGMLLALRDVCRGRRRSVYVPILMLTGATVASFVLFTWRVPIWSAVKASYLLGLSLPYGVFVARAVESLSRRGPAWGRPLPAMAVALVAVAAGVVGLVGVALPRRADAPATGAVRFHFGEYAEASRIYGRLIAGAGYKAAWFENLAAVKLLDGQTNRARTLYARALETGLPDPYRRGRYAVAVALDGDAAESLREFDAALAEERLPEALANRGAVRAQLGDLEGAELDLRAALERSTEIVPGWRNLARVLQAEGRVVESREAWERAAGAACSGPRGYPYGVGTGEVLQWGIGRRWLLLWSEDGLQAAEPSFYREMCASIRGEFAAAVMRGTAP